MSFTTSRFEPPTIAERGHVAKAMNAVQVHRPPNGEAKGSIICPRCQGALKFAIMSNGVSRGYCTCGVKWCQ